MQITETQSEGLKRQLAVVVPASDLDQRLSTYLDDLKGKVRLNGFRPGKVPLTHLRKLYGKAAMADILNDVVSESVRSAFEDRQEKPALQPDVDLDETRIEDVIAGKADLAFKMSYEVLPKIELGTFDAITVEKPVAKVSDEDLQAELDNLAERNKSFAAKDGAAADGDKVKISFVGRIDGTPFEGGSAEDIEIVIGSGQFIPGFEEQLTGVSAGDEKEVRIDFPEEYPAADLAGKEAAFDVTVAEVSAPEPVTVDDGLAERLGLEALEKLRDALRGQMQQALDSASRQKAKRDLLDKLDASYTLDLPQKLVDTEFENIWAEVQGDLERAGKTFADENTTEEAARAEYRGIAERRVTLGLVLSEIGESAKVQVSDEEVQRALYDRVRQFPGKEKQVFEYFQMNQQALASLRAPIFEDKVVDYVLELVTVEEKPVSKAELLADEHEHDHDHGDHDHAHHDHDR